MLFSSDSLGYDLLGKVTENWFLWGKLRIYVRICSGNNIIMQCLAVFETDTDANGIVVGS